MKRLPVLWGVLVAVLVVVNYAIFSKERLLASGETVLLELAPRDPRSLLQGDYMSLRYAIAGEIRQALTDKVSADGHVVVVLDEDGVARFRRIHDEAKPVLADERLVEYRQRGEVIRVAGDAFFFEEGREQAYRAARYGEIKVDRAGAAVLVGLRDGELRRLGEDGGSKDGQ